MEGVSQVCGEYKPHSGNSFSVLIQAIATLKYGSKEWNWWKKDLN